MPAHVSRNFFSPETSLVDSCQQKAIELVARKKACSARFINLVSTGAALPSALKHLHAFAIKFFIAAYATTFGQIPSCKAKTWTSLEKHCLVSKNLKKTWVTLGLHLYKFVMFCTFSPISSLIVGAVFSPQANKKIHDKLGLSQYKSFNPTLTTPHSVQKGILDKKNSKEEEPDTSKNKQREDASKAKENEEILKAKPLNNSNPPTASSKKTGSSPRKQPHKTPSGSAKRPGLQKRPPVGANTYANPNATDNQGSIRERPSGLPYLTRELESHITPTDACPELDDLKEQLSPRTTTHNPQSPNPPAPPPIPEASTQSTPMNSEPTKPLLDLLASIRSFNADVLKKTETNAETNKDEVHTPAKLFSTTSQMFDKVEAAEKDKEILRIELAKIRAVTEVDDGKDDEEDEWSDKDDERPVVVHESLQPQEQKQNQEPAEEIQIAWQTFTEEQQANWVASLEPEKTKELIRTLRPKDRKKVAKFVQESFVKAYNKIPANELESLIKNDKKLVQQTLTRTQASIISGKNKLRPKIQNVFEKK